MLHRLQQALQERQQQQLQRVRRVRHSPQGNEVLMGDSTMLSFCSNDYLGLAADKRVTRALRRGAEQYGVGSGASHLISGHCQSHHLLEQELAEFVGSERALLFSTGYMANLGVVTSLVDRHATVYEDKLNHVSLLDAARLSQARVKRYRH
ncbi:MAG TPA: aminotransferase class I/II-fold pyridoxal phosphate-dependent enzyme, partial [Acidiferrobacteraceae bacterium]|nr:aminotransferase class I/II-fold pyridoxal phosphate-dependent enzyme [Acidiferrobacteraceae bacterium]HEX19391.1 aminotransferase class I/II-fold pyridoxal phosphate-dependent enzyme [Acidiferrobacteraceae bacterium]